MNTVILDAATLIPVNKRINSDIYLDRDSWDIQPEKLINSTDNIQCYLHTSESQRLERCKDAEIIITNKVILDDNLLKQLPKLKLICIAATGYNNIDIESAKNHNIAVANVAGYSTSSVVQICFNLILNLVLYWESLQEKMNAHAWQEHDQFVLLPRAFNELSGKTMGIIGYGTIGKSVANVAKSFGMKVIKAQIPGRKQQNNRLALNEFIPQCDIISLHCPLTPQTNKLVNAEFLSQMKTTAFLINTARGGLIDEQALADCLINKKIAGAGLDVLTTEPPKDTNPLLQNVPNLLITPHIGWASYEARQRLINEIADNILAFKLQQRRNRIV
ncbi:D-2-hydroxyacid dehydrogenase [Pleionea sediminis]|uniref:D-2-hydroxyacid dehydrogenase n=1 Tax=Pleionea sediminis TaxID=2569479 RepID=UPI00118540D9|nr:D-2-hydroxyacid dehydrogenase [Pleionea sediminis]